MTGAEPVHFHVDLDAFFASVEQLDHSEYRGKPVIVGGPPDKRGVVSTCSYEARAFGVHSAMPMVKAVSLCPQAIFVHGRMQRYLEKSREVMAVMRNFSPDVQQISIDEAFLDMTGTRSLFGEPEQAARTLKEQVRERTGLTVSVGAAPNRYIAKIASGFFKPDGLHVVRSGEEALFMAGLPLKDVWGIGAKTRERLEEAGLGDVRSILKCSEQLLASLLGVHGASFLYNAVRGVDTGIFSGERGSRSISSERTFTLDSADSDFLESMLLELSADVMCRMLDEALFSRTVHVKIRYADFQTVSIQETADFPVTDSTDLFNRARTLFRRKHERGKAVRLLGVALYNITAEFEGAQIDLFSGPPDGKIRRVEQALHSLEQKRGKALVTRARLLPQKNRDEFL